LAECWASETSGIISVVGLFVQGDTGQIRRGGDNLARRSTLKADTLPNSFDSVQALAKAMKTVSLLKSCVISAIFSLGCFHSFAQEWTGEAYQPKQCVPQPYNTKQANYELWIRPYRNVAPGGGHTDHHNIQLSITVLEGDNLKPDSSVDWACGDFCCSMTTTFSVSMDGTVSMTSITPMAIQGAGPSRLPAEESREISHLIESLGAHPPDDHSQLPPPGRRLVLQVKHRKEFLARVYDRADIPDPILEILGVIGATLGPLTMNFTPFSSATRQELGEQAIPAEAIGIRISHPRDPATNGLRPDTVTLAISPDRSMIVTRYLPFDPGKTVVTDAKQSVLMSALSGYFLERRLIAIFYASFTPDGHFLLLLSNLPAIYIYDTKTWQQVDTLPGLPVGAVAYYPSREWKYGVAVSKKGEVNLWDAKAGRQLAALDLDGELQNVSFSPDDSLVAITSVRQNKDQSSTFHFRLWETKTGQFIRELRPLYFFEHDETGQPMWWKDGKYLLAETREGQLGSYVVSIWNVDSGRLRGGFSGCGFSDDPFDVALDGQRLFKWCRDGKLLTWNVSAAIDKIAEFESSIKQSPDQDHARSAVKE
jgi:hypothetical protein